MSPQPSTKTVTAATTDSTSSMKVRVPALGINAPVQPVGIDRDGNMAVPSTAFTAGWYRLGPAPGQSGDAVLTCHNTWSGASRALCYNLHTVSVGADVETQNVGGGVHHWTIESIQRVPFSARPAGLFATTGPPRLSIITCDGDWDPVHQTYAFRLIVNARLADTG
jgi:hypothetical protein